MPPDENASRLIAELRAADAEHATLTVYSPATRWSDVLDRRKEAYEALSAAIAEAGEMRKALVQYGEHESECRYMTSECTCGLAKLLERAAGGE